MGDRPSGKSALDAALRFIAIRQRSVAEVKKKLETKGYEQDAIGTVIQTLLDAGYLDDVKFADWLASSRANGKNWGPRKIAFELASKGIAEDIIKSALLPLAESEAKAAKDAYDKWLKKKRCAAPDSKALSGAFRFLKGRGFSTSIIFKTIKGDGIVQED